MASVQFTQESRRRCGEMSGLTQINGMCRLLILLTGFTFLLTFRGTCLGSTTVTWNRAGPKTRITRRSGKRRTKYQIRNFGEVMKDAGQDWSTLSVDA